MGLLSKLFPRKAASAPQAHSPHSSYATFTESSPSFGTWSGTMYEQVLTRSVIERFAVACSKLHPELVGDTSKSGIRRIFETWPNDIQTWPQFLARCATIYEMDTTLFVVPGLDRSGNVVSLYPLRPAYTDVCEYKGEPWFVFHLYNGEEVAIELSSVAVVSKFQYDSDIFGGANEPMDGTLRLMETQREAEENAVRTGARIRFIGRITGMTHGEDLEAKRERFYIDNLSPKNHSGLMLYDNTFDELRQVEEKRFTLDTEEMRRVQSQVFDYFGSNEDILQNHYTEEHYGAWYEGKVEPFSVMLSEAITKAIFSQVERRHGNYVMFSSSKLEYASNASKRNMVRDMIDRGVMTINEGREILQLPPVEGGDVLVARGEYKAADGGSALLGTGSPVEEKDFDLGGDDDIYNDTDGRGEEDKDE